jgi:signal peptidase I
MKAAPQTRHAFKLELAAEILRKFSEVRFIARGTSMLPAIYPGDCLTVKSFGAVAPGFGDIVLCRRADEFRLHRIVSILEEGPAAFYVLRGDALTDDDPPIPAGELLGRVTSIARRGKSFEPNSPQRVHHRLLRSIVRRSKVAAVLLLRWHASQAQDFLHAESLPASSVGAKAECT